MHEKIQIHRLSRRSQKSQRKSTDGGTAYLEPVEFGKKGLHNKSEVHGVIVDVGLCPSKSRLSAFFM